MILELNNGNNFIKKVLDTDKLIIINMIQDICKIHLDISIKVLKNIVEEKDKSKNLVEEEKEHPLLDDAIEIFKGKIIS